MLKINNISSGYGKKQVLFDVSMNVEPGEVVLLTGGNGSGKSTLFKSIFNLVPLTSGEITFKDEVITNYKPFKLLRKGIVYIPQNDFCFENLTIEENILISCNIYSRNQAKLKVDSILNRTNLFKFRNKTPRKLSGGEQKILGIAMGLVHSPSLFLLDEPFAGLDSKNQHDLCNILFENKEKNTSYIIINHNHTLEVSHSKHIKLNEGRVIDK